jgi:uncharacterized phage protein (TIGR01671 family)
MKREILFRGKRIDNGEWIDGSLLVLNSPCNNYKIFPQNSLSIHDSLTVDPITVSQFTDLIDKNGKKIFENDILCREYYFRRNEDGATNHYQAVKFVRFGAYLPDDYENTNSYSWLLGDVPISNYDIDGFDSKNPFWTITSGDLAWRVIGNIFDNPELVSK